MLVSVAVAEDKDIPRLFEIGSLAFGTNEPMWEAFWPDHSIPSGRKIGIERMTLMNNSDKTSTYLKAFDPTTGEIMGMARWLIFENVIPEAPVFDPAFFGGEVEASYVANLTERFLVNRNEAIARNGGNAVSLDCLAVDPKYQRRGVGDALVKWGTKRADELGFEAVVESSVSGKGLYEKNGFVFVKDVKIVWPEPVQDRKPAEHAWLVRPKAVV